MAGRSDNSTRRGIPRSFRAKNRVEEARMKRRHVNAKGLKYAYMLFMTAKFMPQINATLSISRSTRVPAVRGRVSTARWAALAREGGLTADPVSFELSMNGLLLPAAEAETWRRWEA